MKAIVLAAGKGTRMAELTTELPKAMCLIGGKPMLTYVLDNIGFIPQKDTAIIVGYKKEVVTSGIAGEYKFAVQEPQLGTGDAAKYTRMAFPGIENSDENILVCHSDMPLISRETYEGMLSEHEKSRADCTVLTALAPNSGLHYGKIVRENGRFSDIVEYKCCTEQQKKINEVNAAVYVFKARALFAALEKLSANEVHGELLLTDVPKLLLSEGKRVDAYTIDNSNEIFGANTPEELMIVDEIITRTRATADLVRTRWFGTGGWRAIIGDEFIKSNVQKLAQAIADDMKSKGRDEIVIGYDRRFLSDKAAMWAAEVFAGNKIIVYFITRIAPTPLVMFTVKQSGTYYGMAITASHNPADYNGIKVFVEGGRDADVAVTDVFEHIIEQRVATVTVPFEQGMADGTIRMIDPNNDYMDSIISMIDMGAIRKGNLRVLLDPMFGVSKTTLQTILMTARCDVDVINEQHDTLFGGRMPSPTAETLSKLREMVVQEKYDLGIGTDGDADRIGIIDNKGRYIHPNEILALLYYYLLEYNGWRGDCVRNIATTNILDKIAADYGQQCHEVPVGFKHISSKMEQTDAVIGGESSGGLTIRGHIKGKDGIFASTLIVEMICKTGKSISELLDIIYGKYGYSAMAECDERFSIQKKNELWKLLFEDKLLPEFPYEIERVSYMDGCKIYFKNGGWIITRFSGTEPLLRIFCEMETIEEARKCIDFMKNFLTL